jgi:hypothetical protein
LEDKDDGEGAADPEVQKRMDDENMAAATDKVLKKMQKEAEKLKNKGEEVPKSMMLDQMPITPQMLQGVDKRTQKKLRKHLDDEEKILSSESRSKQTWDNIPRFHMDLIMGKNLDKKRKQEKIDKVLAKKKQKDIKNFLEVDPYLTKTAHFEAARDELNKIKGKNDGINNHRGNYHKKQQMLERKKKA